MKLSRVSYSALLILAVLLVACGSPATQGPGQNPAVATTPTAFGTGAMPEATGVTKLTLALGYIPSVQFAPFYVAAERGYYADEGLDVEFKHGIEPDLLKIVGSGDLQYAVASGDEMLVARSQGVPLVYTGAYFQKYPVTLIASEKSGIKSVGDLKGKTVGVPGLFGATYTGLKALLDSAGLKEADVTARSIGFTQVQALQRGQVDAVMGYANNEPLQLKRLGVPVRTFPVWETTNLVSNGIITNESNLQARPDEVGAVVRATMRGLRETIRDPDAAFETSLKYAPEAGSAENRESQLEVLNTSIPLWQSDVSDANGAGYTDPKAWEETLTFLRRSDAVKSDVDLKAAYTNRFVEKDAATR